MANASEDASPVWDDATAREAQRIAQWADREDLEDGKDWTTLALVPEGASGQASVVARSSGVLSGIAALPVLVSEWQAEIEVAPLLADGARLVPGATVAQLAGDARDLLRHERPLLNLLSRLSGIATLTAEYVAELDGLGAQILDTRKTTPGWRRLEKYAVTCGGGINHRVGLFDGLLIKDNHVAFAAASGGGDVAAAAQQARASWSQLPQHARAQIGFLEVEVDTLDQLAAVLPTRPDIVLLDNFSVDSIAQAVQLRNQMAAEVLLEASGGVSISNVRRIAATGVERIAIGALTHSATWIDLGLDWA